MVGVGVLKINSNLVLILLPPILNDELRLNENNAIARIARNLWQKVFAAAINVERVPKT